MSLKGFRVYLRGRIPGGGLGGCQGGGVSVGVLVALMETDADTQCPAEDHTGHVAPQRAEQNSGQCGSSFISV